MTVFNESHVGRRVVDNSTDSDGVIVKFDNQSELSVYVEFDDSPHEWFTNKGEHLFSNVMAISLVEKGDEK